jgi:spore germination protein GerM
MKGRFGLLLLVSVLALGLLVMGCGNSQDTGTGEGDQPSVSDEPKDDPVKVVLYFTDEDGLHLVPEERNVSKGGQTLEEVIVRELIKGPEEAGHHRTIPEEAKLLSVSVVDSIAYVNFSKEFATKHWGGSTGETHTLMSVTNSLCELEGIDKVQFLLEGDKMETLAGHWDISQPLEPQEI